MELALGYFAVHSNTYHEAKEVGKALFDPFSSMREEELKAKGFVVPFASPKELFIHRRVESEGGGLSKQKAAEEWKTTDHEPWIDEHAKMRAKFEKAEKKWTEEKLKKSIKEGEIEYKKLKKEEAAKEKKKKDKEEFIDLDVEKVSEKEGKEQSQKKDASSKKKGDEEKKKNDEEKKKREKKDSEKKNKEEEQKKDKKTKKRETERKDVDSDRSQKKVQNKKNKNKIFGLI
jgi:hypothetical protein